jgi:hypothetical protein
MERLIFFDEASGEQIHALLNPESVLIRRVAGLRPRRIDGLPLAAPEAADDELLFTGGGETEIEMQLLFDTRLSQAGPGAGLADADQPDVRAITGRIWRLAESRPPEETGDWPPPIQVIWGNWRAPVVVQSVAERFEDFTAGGQPQRSWMSLRLVRTARHTLAAPTAASQPPLQGEAAERFAADIGPDRLAQERAALGAVAAGGPLRADLFSHRLTGDARDWRVVMILLGLEDPLQLPAAAPPPDTAPEPMP